MSEIVKSNIKVRCCLPSDAESVLKVHRAAIHGTASSCYPKEIIQDWASPITPSKIKAFADNTVIGEETRILAEINSQIVGFGAIVVSNSELRAVYVSPSFGRSGVGTAILQELERLARERGLSELHLNASLNAEPFYQVNGYINEGFEEHILRSGRKMPSVRMRKKL
ncbi:MAG: GNAT family N-acetyltransferase [Nostoc sp. DedQUE12b]|uniref:GNAT family N-acetyltransferase n=1 Tax=Nostoc sp. DedQUE12b TaxID=3075398 RepID=UPI002AD51B57|nr:GNAT family N-acetyltransferase [Nostoc sp. DedQUE12b]MDZ8084378.1 GNAT family N-acetyltransferase [Nostoc sp. DedQUE12b]